MHETEKKNLTSLIRKIEKERNIEILYAVLSGSRAYGSASEDSDYDVRFFFVQPIKKYLSLFAPISSINEMICGEDGNVYDIVGWDIRNTIQQAAKSNATFWDWMRSSEVIVNKDNFAEKISKVAAPCISKKSLMHAKNGMLYSCIDKMQDGKTTVKEVLSMFRLIMQEEYIARYLNTAPPVSLETLINYKCLPTFDLDTECKRLIELKKAGKGKDLINVPMDFAKTEYEKFKAIIAEEEKKEEKKPDYEAMDAFIAETLGVR